MADALINAIGVALSDAQVDDGTKVFPLANAASGLADHASMNQLKKVTSTQQLIYTATGAEGTALVSATLAARFILMIAREGMILYPVVSAPDVVSYTWDGTTITFGNALNAGERLLILWKNA